VLRYRTDESSSSTGIVNLYSSRSLSSASSGTPYLKPEPVRSLEHLTTPISSIAFHPSSELLATVSLSKRDAFKLVRFQSCRAFIGFYLICRSIISHLERPSQTSQRAIPLLGESRVSASQLEESISLWVTKGVQCYCGASSIFQRHSPCRCQSVHASLRSGHVTVSPGSRRGLLCIC